MGIRYDKMVNLGTVVNMGVHFIFWTTRYSIHISHNEKAFNNENRFSLHHILSLIRFIFVEAKEIYFTQIKILNI